MQEITIRNIKASSDLDNFQVIRFEELYLEKNMEEGLHRHNFFFLMILEKLHLKNGFKQRPAAHPAWIRLF